MTILLLSLIFLFVINAYFSSSINNPLTCFILIWILICLINEFYGFYSISIEAQSIIFLSIFCFSIGFSINFRAPTSIIIYSSKSLDKLLTFTNLLLLLFFPLYLNAVFSLVSYEITNAIAIRDAMTDSNHIGDLNPVISLGLNIPIILSFYFSCVVPLKSKKLLILYAISLFYVILSFSKGYLLQFAFPIFTALYFTGKINKIALFKLLIYFFSIIILMFIIRDGFVDFEVLFKMYTVAPTAALDTLFNNQSALNKPHFKFFIPFYEFLNIQVLQLSDTFWSDVDVPTNVYTAFGLLYNDIGYLPTVICFGFFGFISKISYIYSIHRKSPIFIFILSWSFFAVSTSFFSDAFLGLFTTNIKYLILLILINILVTKISKEKI